MLRLLIVEKVGWLTKVCQLAWKLGNTPKDWQTGAIIPIFKKDDRIECMICREICLTKIVEFKLEDGQCSFSPGRSTTFQLFFLILYIQDSNYLLANKVVWRTIRRLRREKIKYHHLHLGFSWEHPHG